MCDASVGLATSNLAPPAPTLTIDTKSPEYHTREVVVFDVEREQRLVAAAELVSPGSKDRPERGQWFVAPRCNLRRPDVGVSVIDVAMIRQSNLYAEYLERSSRSDAKFFSTPPIYVVTCRRGWVGGPTKLDIWARQLAAVSRSRRCPSGCPKRRRRGWTSK